ncbi:MAG: DUF3179 domain-containing protein [Phycisphaerales bacterium]|nr:DUF3179 domain-containing protein [Phycisphaerales bacterium]
MNRIRFAEGGWVLVLALLVMLALAAWALAPAVLRVVDRPLGDGQDPASYKFDLSQLTLPDTAPLQVALLHRDMVPHRTAIPGVMSAEDASKEASRKGPFLTTDDLVIGVTMNGKARAYPLLLLNVHEAMGDMFDDVPLVVTWHWPSGVTAVYDRRIDGLARDFGVSGLVAGGGQLLFPINTDGSVGGEPLIAQFTGTQVTGPQAADAPITLTPIAHDFTTWGQWREAHPETDVVAGDPLMKRRYKDGKPDTYFHSSGLLFDVPVPDDGPAAKSAAVVLEADGHTQCVTADDVRHHGGQLQLSVGDSGPTTIELTDGGRRLVINAAEGVTLRRGLWHVVHAFGPWESRLKR